MVEEDKNEVEESHTKIKDWQKVFYELYSQADSNRTPEQMWIAVTAHTSSIGENIRKVAFEKLLNSAAHTFCWLCSFVNKCNGLKKDDIFSISESLCGIVSLKYPNKCGHCGQLPCNCDPEKMEGEEDKLARYRELLDCRNRDLKSYEEYSIEDYRKMFFGIYRGRLHIQTLENIGFHFLEEIGEAAVSVRQLSQLRKIADDDRTGIDSAFLKGLTTADGIVQNHTKYHKDPKKIKYASKKPEMLKARVVNAKMDLVAEIADSFSWFCAILNKLDRISKSIYDKPEEHDTLKPLEKVLNDVYIDPATGKARCPSCQKNPCKCAFYNIATGK
jgi:hypothetical protein